MVYHFLLKAIRRHLDETQLLVNQLTDDIIHKEPVISGRPLGEIILHMIRSYEYYSQGLAKDIWKPLSYTLDKYPTAEALQKLYSEVCVKTTKYISEISQRNLDQIYTEGNRDATRLEILMELLEHNIQHRGQILVYYRLLGVEPEKIPYII
jgi:uncharacterized damage-inducible protein DinB